VTQPVYLVDGVRTPMGKLGGGLAHVRPDDLAATVIGGVLARSPQLDPARIDDVYFGNGNGAGEENRNVARMALLLAGVPTSVPGATTNRLCGSGLEAVVQASRAIAVGDADVCVAGGVESMSRAPWVVQKPEGAYQRTDQTMHSTTLGWRMVNPRHPKEWTVALGEGAEIMADEFAISRSVQDAFAMASQQKAGAAWRSHRFASEIVTVPDADLDTDECVRADTNMNSLARLKPVFRRDGGTVTAGNASPMNDGAAALLLAGEDGVAAHGLTPLAEVVSRGVSAVEPQRFGVGPVEAAERALARAGIGWGDLAAVELNEAFASQSLACLQSWPDLNRSIVNPNGGAIALGHPIGASGARILTTLVHHLQRSGGGYGLATMCIGVGQGIAVVVRSIPA
jgi:acetyl-CoA acetyltransferase family protein